MRVVDFLALGAIATLAACNSSPTVTANNATPKEVQDKIAAAGDVQMISPGRWEGVTHITEMKMPGLPPEVQARLATTRGDQKTVHCVTAEEVKASKASLLGDMGGDCKYDHFAMGGGKIDGTATCHSDGGGTMKTTVSGSFSADSYHLDVRAEGTGAKATDNMTLAMSSDAKRVGDCRGTPDES
jgi:hypothetical protein